MRTRELSAEEFLARVIPSLADREAEDNLAFGIALRLAAGHGIPAGAVSGSFGLSSAMRANAT
jgi:hypothetical protein